MNAELEGLTKTLEDIKVAFTNHKHDPATIDQAALEKAALAAIEKAKPARRGETEEIPSVGQVSEKIVGGRYNGMATRDAAFAAWLMTRAHQVMPDKYRKPNDELVKAAMTATGALTGDELVLHGLRPTLWDDVLLDSLVAANLPNKINMPTNPFVIPMGLGTLAWQKGVSVTGSTASHQLATGKSTLTATEQIGEIDWEYDLEEDAIIAVRPTIEARIRQSAAEQIDYFVINADNDTSNNINAHDNGASAATQPFLSNGENGLRELFQVQNTAMSVDAAGAALSDTHILNALALLGKYAVNPKDLLFLCDVATYFKGVCNLDGIQTLSDIGTSAVLLTGQVAAYRGYPIIVSASIHRTEADHFVDDADTGTFGQAILFNKNMWTLGYKRGITVEVDRDIQKRQVMMVISFRLAVCSHGGVTKTALTHTAGISHILVT